MKTSSFLVSALVLPMAALAAPASNPRPAPGTYGGACGNSVQCQDSMCCWTPDSDGASPTCVYPKAQGAGSQQECKPAWIWSYSLVHSASS
ncbi:hypothetical protein RhiJN_07939 [Ceratobasidium sp. AG-Ba]|nr:hypothetical protein RhiJN_07939 [Ceratobasidium sp. AG-Ba]QRW08750.1 hypothetical protein RhiLY_07749 [Ceratobasidium sp. AG-Ba]